MAELTEEQKRTIERIYETRFGCDLTSLEPGVDRVFGGKLATATYKASEGELISDVVYIDREGSPLVFSTTQELILFLQRKSRLMWIDDVFESKMFTGIIFLLLLTAIFLAGRYQEPFNEKALTILGSVVGLAAGLFFGAGRK